MKRYCIKCHKVLKCRKNHTCLKQTQKLCVACNRKLCKEWYENNRQKKIDYQSDYYYRMRRKNIRHIRRSKNSLKTEEEKLKALFK